MVGKKRTCDNCSDFTKFCKTNKFIPVIVPIFGEFTMVIKGNLHDYLKLLRKKVRVHNSFSQCTLIGVFQNLAPLLHTAHITTRCRGNVTMSNQSNVRV